MSSTSRPTGVYLVDKIASHLEKHSLNAAASGETDISWLAQDRHSSQLRAGEPLNSSAPTTRISVDGNLRETISLRILATGLIEEAKWCWFSKPIHILDTVPTPLVFHREYVHKNIPCIIRGLDVCKGDGIEWSDLVERSGGSERTVRVNVTPTGRGDAVVELSNAGSNSHNQWSLSNPVKRSDIVVAGDACASVLHGATNDDQNKQDTMRVFVKPFEEIIPMGDFIQWVTSSSQDQGVQFKNDVLYLSAQNDSFREEFSSLVTSGIAPPSLPFGDHVFGKPCDAANLWIGNERAVSTMHRDVSYENLYCVLKGQKVFHLMPPCCAIFLNERPRRNAAYVRDGDKWTVKLEEGETPWIAIDVACVTEGESNAQQWPQDEFELFNAHPELRDLVVRVEVNAGETLYLPAGWLHRVTQTCPTAAVNYWYDRDFNAQWAMTEAIESLVRGSVAHT